MCGWKISRHRRRWKTVLRKRVKTSCLRLVKPWTAYICSFVQKPLRYLKFRSCWLRALISSYAAVMILWNKPYTWMLLHWWHTFCNKFAWLELFSIFFIVTDTICRILPFLQFVLGTFLVSWVNDGFSVQSAWFWCQSSTPVNPSRARCDLLVLTCLIETVVSMRLAQENSHWLLYPSRFQFSFSALTERRGRVVNTPTSYPGDPVFKSRPGALPPWLFFFPEYLQSNFGIVPHSKATTFSFHILSVLQSVISLSFDAI
jgi:hypothetical protein